MTNEELLAISQAHAADAMQRSDDLNAAHEHSDVLNQRLIVLWRN